jgi:hypothetical protein
LLADYEEHFEVVRQKMGKRKKEFKKSSIAEGKRDRTRTAKKRKTVWTTKEKSQ